MYERRYSNRALVQDVPKVRKPLPWKRMLFIFAGIVCVGIFVWVLQHPRVQVSTVVVSGTNVITPEDISLYITERLQGRYFGMIPRTSIFLVGPKHLELMVKARFPRIRTITIERTGLTTLAVSIDEYKGTYLWCVEGAPDLPCAFMSDDGVVFASAPYFSGSAYPKVFGEEVLLYPAMPIAQESLALIATLQKRLVDIGIIPNEFHFVSPYTLTMVFSHHEYDAKLSIDPTLPIEQTLETLYGGLRTEPVANMYRDESRVLEYLDVRFAQKLVYKFQP